MSKSKTRRVTDRRGNRFEVRTAKMIMRRFGFQSGDKVKILTCGGWHRATIVGVAREYEWHQFGPYGLWFTFVGDRGRVNFANTLKKGHDIVLWNEKKRVTSTHGDSFLVDVSKRVVGRFGFHSGDKVEVRNCGTWFPATVVGVAHEYPRSRKDKGQKTLWAALENSGKVIKIRPPASHYNIRLAKR